MEPARKIPADSEAERLRAVFTRTFQDPLDEIVGQGTPETSSQAADLSGAGGPAEKEFDWSVTLANVHQLSRLVESNQVLLEAAEERARVAETRAAEAVLWLRRLHDAVLQGLPQGAR